MPVLHSIDLVIVGAYLVLTLVLGLWLRRRATQSLEHYYLGGRQLPWPLLGVSGMTNWFDLTGTMIITSFLFLLGPRGLYVEFRGGAVLALAFMLLWTGKWFRRSGCMTGPEWYAFRFGSGRSATILRVTSALFGIVFTVGLLAYLVRGTSLFIGYFIPSAPLAATIVLMVLSVFYTMLSGFYGVVVNDLLQGIIIIVACVIVSLLAFQMVPGADAIGAAALKVTGNPEWLSSFPEIQTFMPPGYEAYEMLLMVAGFYLVRSMLDGSGAGDDSRYFAARTDRDCGLLSLLQGITIAFRWPMMMGFAVIGIFLVAELLPSRDRTGEAAAVVKAHAPTLAPADWHAFTMQVASFPEQHASLAAQIEAKLGPRWRDALPLVGFNGSVNPEQVLPAVLKHSLSPGIRGLVLVAMLAAMMSTLSGTVNGVGSAMFVRDIYQNILRPRARNRELMFASYGATAGIVLLGFYLGLAARNINHLWGWLMMGFVAGALAPKLLRLYWWRCNAWGCATGIATGGFAAVVQRAWWPELAEWKIFLLTAGLGFVGVVLGSLCTPATPSETVRQFYRRTRPFGFWAPFWKELSATEQTSWRKEHRNDQIALPFTLLAQITIFLLPMQVVLHAWSDFWKTLPWFVAAAAGMYWFWWRNLPAGEPAAAAVTHPILRKSGIVVSHDTSRP
jgi:solute:Na+ symporter, SSS family